MTLRTLGRGFWIGLVGSIGLHAALLSTGSFDLPRTIWLKPNVLEARIESEESGTTPQARPEIVSKAEKTPAPLIEPPIADAPPEPAPPADPATLATNAEPVVDANQPPFPAAEESAPAAYPPLPDGEPSQTTGRPHAALSHAAQNLKELPRFIEIVYELKGMVSGRQTQIWRREDNRYTLESTAEATGLAAIFLSGKMTQKSSGRIGPLGLIPEHYEMQRLSGKKEILLFKYDDNLIEASRIDSRKGKRTAELPLITGAQDPLSSVYQLAMIAQDTGEGVIVAAGAKRIKGYPYRSFGTETIQTPLGEVQALHVTRAGDSDKGAVHLWLAPKHRYLPVKITYIDDDGTEWVLEAISIKTD